MLTIPPKVFSLLLLLLTAFSRSTRAGSCFKMRLPNGQCHHIIGRNSIKRHDCCRLGGFYVSHHLSGKQFFRDLLLHRSGVSNCHYPCQSALEYFLGLRGESCSRIRCPAGYKCELQAGRAACVCSSSCTMEDFASGPVCTTDFRQFRNRCSFMKERCRNQDVLLEEMACSLGEHVCPYKRGFAGAVDDYDLPVKICPRHKVCIVRQYSGKAVCEDPKWLGRKQIESAVANDMEMDDLAVCSYGQFKTPICGTDGNTYENQCRLRLASVLRGIEIRIAHMGHCRANATCANVKCQSPIMMCVPHVNTRQPVCLDCSVLPPNCNPTVMPSPAALELDVAAADMALFEMSKEAEQSFGDPRWRGEVFTNGWPKVCGSNHQTFPNACFLQVFNCIARRYIDLVSTGSCTEPN